MRARPRRKTIVLVTHYPEDVIPEIARLVLVKDGAVFADGPKERPALDDTMSALFGVPLRVNRTAVPAVAKNAEEDAYFCSVSAY